MTDNTDSDGGHASLDQFINESGSESKTDETTTSDKPTTNSDGQTELSPSAVQVTSQDGNDERATPKDLIRKLQAGLDDDVFDLDPCSGAEPDHFTIARKTFTKADDGLSHPWFGHVYCNPPYSKLLMWLKYITSEMQRPDGPKSVSVLLPANTSTQWFQKFAAQGDIFCLIEGRLNFQGTEHSAPFASILVIFGEVPLSYIENVASLGTLLTKVEANDASVQKRLDDLVPSDGGVTPAIGSSHLSLDPAEPQLTPIVSDATHAGEGEALLDLRDVRIGDIFEISMDDTAFGHPTFLDDSARVKIVTTVERDDRAEILGVTENEQYFVLSQCLNNRDEVHLAAEGRSWESVPLENARRIHAPSLQANVA